MIKSNSIFMFTIFMLMMATGLILYFMYFKIDEPFNISSTTPNPIPSPTPSPIPTPSPAPTPSQNPDCPQVTTNPRLSNKSIMSRHFGIGFNIEYVKTMNETDFYLIKHIPTIATKTSGGCYSVSNANLLSIKLKNSTDESQLWTITENEDSISKYFVAKPKINNDFALQYENGNLALRPYYSTNIFEGQKWLIKDIEISRGIPVLNYSPGSLFTPEFDPYSSEATYSSDMSEQNVQQVNDVISSVKVGIQQYLNQLDNNYEDQTQDVSMSSLGKKETPLNVNINLSSKESQKETFSDTNNNKKKLSNEMLSIMDKYGVSASNQGSKYTELYNKTDLENEINKYQGCKILDINDYTSNRVGSCNCKL